jgi:thiamine biosynthesis lipoprotein ApbE
LITRPEESYRLWRVVLCDQENLENEEAKTRYRVVKIQPQWVVTSGKQQQTTTIIGEIYNRILGMKSQPS